MVEIKELKTPSIERDDHLNTASSERDDHLNKQWMASQSWKVLNKLDDTFRIHRALERASAPENVFPQSHRGKNVQCGFLALWQACKVSRPHTGATAATATTARLPNGIKTRISFGLRP